MAFFFDSLDLIREFQVNGEEQNQDDQGTNDSEDYTNTDNTETQPQEPQNDAPDNDTNDEGNTDYTQDQSDDTPTAPTDEPVDDEGDAEDPADNSDGDNNTDYTLPDDEEAGDDTDENTEDYTDDSNSIDSGNDMGGDMSDDGDNIGGQSDDEITALDKELFSDLSEEEMKAKNISLKKHFLELYQICSNAIAAIDNIEKVPNTIQVVDFIGNTLNNLRNMVADYSDNIYDSKSYIENYIYYNKCLATLSGINKVLRELGAAEDKK